MAVKAPSIDLRRLGALEADAEAAAAAWHGLSRQVGDASRTFSDLNRRKNEILALQPRVYSDGAQKRADLDQIEKQIAEAGAELKELRGALEDAQERLDAANSLRDACRSYVGAAR